MLSIHELQILISDFTTAYAEEPKSRQTALLGGQVDAALGQIRNMREALEWIITNPEAKRDRIIAIAKEALE